MQQQAGNGAGLEPPTFQSYNLLNLLGLQQEGNGTRFLSHRVNSSQKRVKLRTRASRSGHFLSPSHASEAKKNRRPTSARPARRPSPHTFADGAFPLFPLASAACLAPGVRVCVGGVGGGGQPLMTPYLLEQYQAEV